MILSITDGIEVAEHTEPQERYEFLCDYLNASFDADIRACNGRTPRLTYQPEVCALMARQAE